MVEHSNIRCMRCEAPIPFRPGAGSRLCPFCGTINLSREQEIAVLPIELKIDDIFRSYQLGQLKTALEQSELMMRSLADNFRLAFYRASILLEMGRSEDAIFALIDLSGMDAPSHLRADAQAKLAEALLAAQRSDEAQEAAERSLQLLDGHPPASYMLARTMMEKKRWVEAEQTVKDTIERLDRKWRITFPIRPYNYRLLLARIAEGSGDHPACADTLLKMLLQNPAAPIDAVAKATRMLGLALLKQAPRKQAAHDLLERGALLDPENRYRLLDAMKESSEANDLDLGDALQSLKDKRSQLLREIQQALVADDTQGVQAEQLAPEMDLTLIHSDADLRCDRLERAALRLNLPRFDRGTLYPLRSIEDFRRWVGAWRLRVRLETLRQAWSHSERRQETLQIRQKHLQLKTASPPARRRSSRRHWTHWVIGLLSFGILLMAAFLLFAGNRYLDQFEGKLLRIKCEDGSEACTLIVATGRNGRKRHQSVKQAQTGPERWWLRWKHGHVGPDGVLEYDLRFPWGDLDHQAFRACVGKPIAKLPLTLTPLCGNLDEDLTGS